MDYKIFNIILINLICIINRNYNSYVKKLVNEIIELIWIPIIYCVIKLFNLKNNLNVLHELDVKYINILFILISIYLILDILNNYKSSKMKYINSMIPYIEYSISIPILINAINNQFFSLILWVTIILITINIKIYSKELINNKKPNLHKMSERPCDSYDNLFPSRKKQAESIINYINSYRNNDRFTMVIDSEWGTGKTSLIKAIENKCTNDYNMIFIQPMLFDKRDLLIKYFCERLSEILLKGNIYTGQGSNIQKYLIALLKWTDNKSNTKISDILLKKDSDDFRKIKEELQVDIYQYTEKVGKIIVIIDDCDRSDYDTVKEVLMFIREIIDFEAINTIILMQYSKLLVYGFDNDYLDKYIDKIVQLNKVPLLEIISTFIDDTIDEEIAEKYIKDHLLEFKSEIELTISEIETLVKEPFIDYEKKINNNNSKNQKDDLEILLNNKNEYEKLLDTFKAYQKNIRLIKKIIKELIDTYYKLQINDSNSLLSKNDLKFIFKIMIIKNLFIDEYYNIQQYWKSQQYFDQIYFGYNVEQVCIRSLLPELTKQKYVESLEKINRYLILDSILKFDCDSVILETKTNLEKILTLIDDFENILENDYVCREKDINSINDITNIVNNLYTYAYTDFQKNKDYILLNNRLKKINNSLIRIPDTYKFNKENIMLNVYCNSISGIFERNEDNYILIKDIYYTIKNTRNKINQNDINTINNLLKEIREINLRYIIRFIKQFILKINEDEEIKIEYFSDQKDINQTLLKKFNINNNNRYQSEDFKDFECILYEIKKEFIKNYSDIIDVNYVYTNLSKYIIVIKIIKRLEKIIEERANIIDEFNNSYTVRDNIEYCKDYDKFFKLSNTIIASMLDENHILQYNDINNIYGMINNCYNFLSNKNINNLIINIGKACDKFKCNRYPNDYSYYQVQELLIYFNKLAKKTS